MWVGEGRRGDMKEGWRRGGGFGVDAAPPTAFVKIIKHFFPVQNSFYVFVFSGKVAAVTTPSSRIFHAPSPVSFFSF